MLTNPLVTVLMSVYNAEKFVEHAVRSIINQTFKEFEFIVIDDGSTDQTHRILAQFDKKVVKVYSQENRGVTASLNRGLLLAKGKYIARMDADDIALPERLQKQVGFLESHSEIGIVGSAVQVINDSGRKWGVQTFAPTDIGIRWVSLVKNPFVHPSVMFRKNLLDEYNLEYRPSSHAEDYDLWVRLLKFTKGSNIEQPLLLYRVHKSNISKLHRNVQFESHYSISRDQIRSELPQLEMDDFQIKKLLTLALASSREFSLMRKDRTDAILSYLLLWRAFFKKYGSTSELEHSELEQLQSSVIGRAIGWSLFPPMPPGKGKILHLINQIDSYWYLDFLTTLPKSLDGFVRERLVWMF